MTAACTQTTHVVVTLRDGRHTAIPAREAWFAEGVHRREIAAAAKAICERCPEQADCLNGARARREEHGIWGGADFSDEERDQRRQQRSKPIRHGTEAGYTRHRRNGEDCPLCREAHARYVSGRASRKRQDAA